jgi:hypothetical protein
MTVLEIKTNFHNLIDSIDDNELLSQFYEIMRIKRNSKVGEVWKFLSEKERAELLLSESESKNEANLLSNEDVKMKYL